MGYDMRGMIMTWLYVPIPSQLPSFPFPSLSFRFRTEWSNMNSPFLYSSGSYDTSISSPGRDRFRGVMRCKCESGRCDDAANYAKQMFKKQREWKEIFGMWTSKICRSVDLKIKLSLLGLRAQVDLFCGDIFFRGDVLVDTALAGCEHAVAGESDTSDCAGDKNKDQ